MLTDSELQKHTHYCDVKIGAMTSQITGLVSVYSTVYSVANQRKHQNSASLASVPMTGEFPAQMASNAENVFIWWRHHDRSANSVQTSWNGMYIWLCIYDYNPKDVYIIAVSKMRKIFTGPTYK